MDARCLCMLIYYFFYLMDCKKKGTKNMSVSGFFAGPTSSLEFGESLERPVQGAEFTQLSVCETESGESLHPSVLVSVT